MTDKEVVRTMEPNACIEKGEEQLPEEAQS